MASDQLVEAQDVLEAVRQLRRRPQHEVLQTLEQTEPDLAEHLMEELSRLHRLLLHTSMDQKQVRRIYRQGQSLALVSVLALRQATLRHWHEQMTDSGVAHLDPSPEPPDSTADENAESNENE